MHIPENDKQFLRDMKTKQLESIFMTMKQVQQKTSRGALVKAILKYIRENEDNLTKEFDFEYRKQKVILLKKRRTTFLEARYNAPISKVQKDGISIEMYFSESADEFVVFIFDRNESGKEKLLDSMDFSQLEPALQWMNDKCSQRDLPLPKNVDYPRDLPPIAQSEQFETQ